MIEAVTSTAGDSLEQPRPGRDDGAYAAARTTRHVELRRGGYRDSVALMEASRTVGAIDGVSAALVAMATELNISLLTELGFDPPQHAGPNDLVIALAANDVATLSHARVLLDQVLATPTVRRGGAVPAEPTARLMASVAGQTPANVGLVSVPGRYAFAEAMDALEAGLPVMVFSDNMPIEQEVRLKHEAADRGLIAMGPDCGTAMIGGVGLGFANAVPAGPVGIVAASGTGAQQLMCLLAAADVGISHCLGVGGRDLSEPVGGQSTLRALELLDADPTTEIIVVVSKPPEPSVAAKVTAVAEDLDTPVVLDLAGDLTALAGRLLERLDWTTPRWLRWEPPTPAPRRSGALRGLYAGGTLRDEAYALARPRLGRIAVDDPGALGHLLIDFGDDRFTLGRPHPIIDPALRVQRLRKDLADPATGVILIDVMLGYGAHPSPSSAIAEAVVDVTADGIVPPVVAALVGTAADPQRLDDQARILTEAGAWVFLSHAEAVGCALDLLGVG